MSKIGYIFKTIGNTPNKSVLLSNSIDNTLEICGYAIIEFSNIRKPYTLGNV